MYCRLMLHEITSRCGELLKVLFSRPVKGKALLWWHLVSLLTNCRFTSQKMTWDLVDMSTAWPPDTPEDELPVASFSLASIENFYDVNMHTLEPVYQHLWTSLIYLLSRLRLFRHRAQAFVSRRKPAIAWMQRKDRAVIRLMWNLVVMNPILQTCGRVYGHEKARTERGIQRQNQQLQSTYRSDGK
jgi:hypothetical protein